MTSDIELLCYICDIVYELQIAIMFAHDILEDLLFLDLLSYLTYFGMKIFVRFYDV